MAYATYCNYHESILRLCNYKEVQNPVRCASISYCSHPMKCIRNDVMWDKNTVMVQCRKLYTGLSIKFGIHGNGRTLIIFSEFTTVEVVRL